jgi:Tol biopolymer transport system component
MARRGWIVRSGLGTVAALAAARAAEAPGRDAATLVFSARQWQGEYRTDPDNRAVVFSHTARGYVLALKDLARGELRTLAPDLPESFCPQFTPDGRTIVFVRRDGDVYRVAPDGSGLKRLTQGNTYVEFRLAVTDKHGSSDPPALSPDGTRIAYLAVRDGLTQVHVMALDGSDQRQITSRPTACGRVKWSPDGRRLAFVSWQGAFPQLFVVATAGGGQPQPLTRLDAAVYWLDWQPLQPADLGRADARLSGYAFRAGLFRERLAMAPEANGVGATSRVAPWSRSARGTYLAPSE